MGALARRGRVTRGAVAAALLLALAAASGCGKGREAAETPRDQPYAGLEEREIKALAPGRVEELVAGEGAGYALAAELNRHPGPAHAVELSEELELSPAQAEALRRIEARVHARTKPLGRHLVALERELDRAFRSGTATAAGVAELTGRIARVEGQLRFAHLAGHLETRKLLTPHQIARYDELRGYGHGHEPGHEAG